MYIHKLICLKLNIYKYAGGQIKQIRPHNMLQKYKYTSIEIHDNTNIHINQFAAKNIY